MESIIQKTKRSINLLQQIKKHRRQTLPMLFFFDNKTRERYTKTYKNNGAILAPISRSCFGIQPHWKIGKLYFFDRCTVARTIMTIAMPNTSIQINIPETDVIQNRKSSFPGALNRAIIAVSKANRETSAAVKLITFAADSTGLPYF